MQVKEITYTTDLIKPYFESIRKCKTIKQLLLELETNWSELLPKAIEQACLLSDKQWKYILIHERNIKYHDQIRIIAEEILSPDLLLKISYLSFKYGLCDGCAYIKIKEHELEEI